jgi:hypothetical protein
LPDALPPPLPEPPPRDEEPPPADPPLDVAPPLDTAWPPLPEPPPEPPFEPLFECWPKATTGTASSHAGTSTAIVRADHTENVRFMKVAPESPSDGARVASQSALARLHYERKTAMAVIFLFRAACTEAALRSASTFLTAQRGREKSPDTRRQELASFVTVVGP